MRIVALIPAHNEASSILETVRAMLRQRRLPDQIVVICDNCTDETYQLAAGEVRPGNRLRVVRTERNQDKKPGALNWAWREFCQGADLLVTLDADTVLPPNAVGDWEQEFEDDPRLGGSSSKFTMPGDSLLVRLQRYEFARWTHQSLRRGWTSVLAGTGCAIRNDALTAVAARADRDGPWLYESKVEDFELTHRIRELGYYSRVSPTVRAYTDAMDTVPALWGQRMKWQVGTVEDLLRMGFRRRTRLDWGQQLLGLAYAFMRLLWPALVLLALLTHHFRFVPLWLAPTGLFVLNDFKHAFLVPHRDRWDVILAVSLLPLELFAYMRAAWFLAGWHEALVNRLTGREKDRWLLQERAEAAGRR